MAGSPYFGGSSSGGGGGGSPYFGGGGSGKSSGKKSGGGIVGDIEKGAHWAAKKAEIAAHDVKSIPGGVIDLGKGLATHPVRTVKLAAKATEQTVRHPLRDPFMTALTLAGLASGVGSAVGRAAAIGDALEEGGAAGSVLRAAAKTPAVKPRMLKVGDDHVSLHASKNPAVRAGQGAYDKVLQKALDTKPEGKVAGHAHKRVGGALDEQMRYQARIREAPAGALERAAKKLGRVKGEGRIHQAALELTSVNTSPAAAAAYHLGQAAKGVDPLRNRTVAKLYQTVADRKLLTKNESGDMIVSSEHPKLAAADVALAKVQGRGDEILARYGVRSEEALQSAKDAPAKYRAGAYFEKPTAAKQGVVSRVLQRERARLVSLERRHGELLAKDAKNIVDRKTAIGRLTATQPGVSTIHTPLSEADAQARLADLDKQYEKMLEKFAPEVNPYSKELAASETRSRNTMRGRMAAGKKPATGRSVEGRVGGGTSKIKTVSQEVRDLAEAKLHDVIAKHPGNASVQRARGIVDERDRLRATLNARAEASFSNGHGPALPSTTHSVIRDVPKQTGGKSVGLDNPFRERIVTLGHAIEEQKTRLARVEKAAAARVKPTGIIGGKTARPGRGHISYASSEKRAPGSSAAASPGPVVGVAKPPITSHANTGFNIEHGKIPANVTTGAARHFRQITRFVNTTERRNAAIRTGSDVRRSTRDVLVKVPGAEHAKLSHAINEALGKEKPTVDEIHGLNAALEAFREDMVPGLADNFSGDAQHPVGTSAKDAAAERGLAAPSGYKWVDRNALGDLAKPSAGPRGRIARSADNINSAVTAATVYFKIGHVGTRVFTNAATNIIQGSAKPTAIARAAKLWDHLDHEDRLRALAASGQHSFDAMPHEGTSAASKVAGKGANWWAKHVDAPFRFNSIAYEARKAGFDTPDKFRGLLDRLENPHDHNMSAAETAKVDWVAKRANREGIAYDRLSAAERRFITRAVWFYPWVRGTAGFAWNTVTEHPFKSTALAVAGQEGRKAQQNELGDLPSYEQGLFKLAGGTRPLVADFSTFSPFATPADLANAVARPAELSGMLNPVYGAGNMLINGQNQFGSKSQHPVTDALASLLATTPEAQVATAYLNRHKDQSKRMFKTTPLSALLRTLVGPGTPRRINLEAGHSSAARERSGR